MTGEGITRLTDETFDREVRKGSGAVLVNFRAGWCRRCSSIQQHLEELAAEEAATVMVAAVDVDDSEEVPHRFGIRSVPTLILFKNGKMVDQLIGAAPKDEILRLIRRSS